MRYFLILCLLFISVSCVNKWDASTSAEPSKQEDPQAPGSPNPEPPNNPNPSPAPIPDIIENRYPFLKSDIFWQEIEAIKDIPKGKDCSNQSSYAYFGIARVANTFLRESFAMFPFEVTSMRYYKFPDRVEPTTPKDFEIFGVDELFEKLLVISDQSFSDYGRELTLTGITKHSDFGHDEHCRHRGGNTIDMRPWPGINPITWRSKEYDKKANLDFIRKVLQDPEVSVVFFNDPKILKDKEVKSIVAERASEGNPVVFQEVSGHDNHIHIEFKFPDPIVEISDYVFEKLHLNKVLKSSLDDEYRNH